MQVHVIVFIYLLFTIHPFARWAPPRRVHPDDVLPFVIYGSWCILVPDLWIVICKCIYVCMYECVYACVE